jgi:hypothetical protein
MMTSTAIQKYSAFVTHRIFCLPATLIGEILIDNQSQDHIFGNMNMVEDVRDAASPVTFEGIGGRIEVTKVATFSPLGVTVYYHPKAPANLLSFGKLRRENTQLRVNYDDEFDRFMVQTEHGDPLIFENQDDLYILKTRTPTPQ